MKKRYLFLLIIFVLLILSLGRYIWMQSNYVSEAKAEITKGNLDLRDWDIFDDEVLILDGEWEFYPGQFLYGENTQRGEDKTYINVPNSWNDSLSEEDSTPYGYGSYRLQVLVDKASEVNYSVYISSIRSASEIYINGRLVEKTGIVATTENAYKAENLPYSVSFRPDENGIIEIVIQAANYEDPRGAGIIRSVKFGTEKVLEGERTLSTIMQAMAIGIFFLLSMYLLVFYFIGKRNKRLLAFSIFLICLNIMVNLSSSEKLMLKILPLNYEWLFRMTYILLPICMYLLLQTMDHKSLPIWRKVYPFFGIGIALLTVTTAFLSIETIIFIVPVYYLFLCVALVITIFAINKQFVTDVHGSFLILLSLLTLLHDAGWTWYWRWQGMSIAYYPFDIMLAVSMYSTIWFLDYIKINAETEKLAENLERVNRQKDYFLAHTSHEFKNPLNGILNLTQSVLERESPLMKEKSVRELKTIMTVGRRMTVLLNDLIDRASLQDGVPRLHKSPVSLLSIITNVVDLLVFAADSKNIRFCNDVSPDFPLVYADENRLTQIMYNLIHNAVKYTEYGEITIRATVHGQKAYISIEDTGEGMDDQTKEILFDTYERGADDGGGFGLGLSITKQLVELHDGEIMFTSEVGIGSTFTFTLLISEMENYELEELHTQTVQETGIKDEVKLAGIKKYRPRILVVDDEPVNLHVLQSMLNEEDYDVKVVINGEQALQAINESKWNLVISDVMMPKMSGYELTKKIRNHFTVTELPVLLVTARSNPKDIEAGFLAGANDYVRKPLEAVELRARVNSLTKMKEMVNKQLQLESAWLQAQIHPHFIFNTLNSIAALSEFDPEKMRELLNEFSNFLRSKYQYHQIDELIPLKEELNIVRSYLNIEQVRFGERLHVSWEIEDTENIKVPFLSIQPLVENAVHHGLMMKIEGGQLTIRIKEYDDKIKIIVEDDGVGMDVEKLSEVMNRENATHGGVGLMNTHQRIKRLFGTGLTVNSEKDKGTIVSFFVNK